MTLELSLQLQEAGGSRKLTVAIGGAGRSRDLQGHVALQGEKRGSRGKQEVGHMLQLPPAQTAFSRTLSKYLQSRALVSEEER